jgi:hypothetical protein
MDKYIEQLKENLDLDKINDEITAMNNAVRYMSYEILTTQDLARQYDLQERIVETKILIRELTQTRYQIVETRKEVSEFIRKIINR